MSETAPMSDAEKVLAEWTAAMEGADEGPWEVREYGDGDSLVIHSGDEWRICFMATPGSSPNAMERIEKTAAFIARCSPAGIRSLLNLIADQAATIAARDDELIGERWHADEAARQRDVVKAALTAAEAEKERLLAALQAADATLTERDAFALDPIVGSDNPHEHAAGLVRAALSEKEQGA